MFYLIEEERENQKVNFCHVAEKPRPEPRSFAFPRLILSVALTCFFSPFIWFLSQNREIAHKSVVTYSLTVTRVSGLFRSSSIWGNEDVVFLPDPNKDVLREISHLKTVIKSSTSLSGEFPQIHLIFHNLSLCFQH